MKRIKICDWLVPAVIWLTVINILWLFPISKGDKYVNRLNKWYALAENNQWERAAKLEKGLDQADLQWFKERNRSEELKKSLNSLTVKDNKTADEWMEMASILRRLSKNEESRGAIKKAYEVDPIRNDIEKIYFSSF